MPDTFSLQRIGSGSEAATGLNFTSIQLSLVCSLPSRRVDEAKRSLSSPDLTRNARILCSLLGITLSAYVQPIHVVNSNLSRTFKYLRV